MPEDFSFYNPLNTSSFNENSGIDQALDELENAFSRFELILARHMGHLNAVNLITGGKTNKTRIIAGSIAKAFDLFSGKGLPTGTVFNPNAQKKNRFPSSSGQILADLASSIQRIIGRNL